MTNDKQSAANQHLFIHGEQVKRQEEGHRTE